MNWYAYGYKTREQAAEALEKAFTAGEIVEGECPEIVSYRYPGRPRRWGITWRH